MNITGSLFAVSQLESIKKKIEADRQLEEVTLEDQEQREGEPRKPSKEPVPADKGVERVSETTDTRKGSDLSVLRKEDETSSMPSRGRKRRKLSKSEPG